VTDLKRLSKCEVQASEFKEIKSSELVQASMKYKWAGSNGNKYRIIRFTKHFNNQCWWQHDDIKQSTSSTCSNLFFSDVTQSRTTSNSDLASSRWNSTK